MKCCQLFSILCLAGFFACNTTDLTLINNGTTVYQIVLPMDADSLEKRSATELQYYLEKISGKQLPITDENGTSSERKILVGNTIPGKSLNAKKDEIIIQVKDGDLFILGGGSISTLYAVYTFLENYLGCRFYAPDAEIIPASDRISIPGDLDHRYTPQVTTRTVHSRLYYENPAFADKRKVTHEAFPGYIPGYGVHTFNRFVPSSEYYRGHPEYYAMRDGRRIPTQLCLTNEDVLGIVKNEVAAVLDRHPDLDVISVSTNDNTQYCQCESCAAIDEREESNAGTVIEFVNKVAAEFPDKTISTLAYQYTRKAPKYVRPGENVLITLASIECDRSAPIEDKCQDFAEDLMDWGKISDNIRIWDYTTQFTNFLAPFPNIFTLQPNIRFFRDNNARWIFEQHSHHPSELFAFRSYLTARLLWNPDLDQDALIADFMNGYYQEAGPYVRKYITTIHDEIRQDSGFFLFLYGDPAQGFRSFLRPELLKQYDSWYDEAAKAVDGKPEILDRVHQARLSTDYAILEAARLNDPQSYALTATGQNGDKSIPDDIRRRLDRFAKTCQDADITLMNEMRFSVDEYLEFYEYTLSRALEENIALGKNVLLLQQPKKYAGEDPQALTDGAFGGTNFNASWLGFEGNDLEAIIDLERITKISRITGDFLQTVNHIVFFPTDVKYYYSEDGKNYRYLGEAANKRPLTKQSKITDIQSFSCSFPPVMARFVKVVANNMDKAPIWHHGAGLPSWIFVDEIMVGPSTVNR